MTSLIHDAIVVAISVSLTAALAGVGWLAQQRRERINTRILVAAEIVDNYATLERIHQQLERASQQDNKLRSTIAQHFDLFHFEHFQWDHPRWSNTLIEVLPKVKTTICQKLSGPSG